MEKFRFYVSGTAQEDFATIKHIDIEGTGTAIMSVLAFVIRDMSEQHDISEDKILEHLQVFVKLNKERN